MCSNWAVSSNFGVFRNCKVPCNWAVFSKWGASSNWRFSLVNGDV
jgi:hypothetical protein